MKDLNFSLPIDIYIGGFWKEEKKKFIKQRRKARGRRQMESTIFLILFGQKCLLFFRENKFDFQYDGENASVQFSSVTQLCPTLCDPMNCSTPGLPVHHQLLESTQTHVHWVGDAIQPSHPLSSPSPPALNLSQHQGLFQWVNSSHQVRKYCSFSSISVLPVNTQDWSPLGWTGWISLQSKGLSRLFSNTTVQKHQFFGAILLLTSSITMACLLKVRN